MSAAGRFLKPDLPQAIPPYLMIIYKSKIFYHSFACLARKRAIGEQKVKKIPICAAVDIFLPIWYSEGEEVTGM